VEPVIVPGERTHQGHSGHVHITANEVTLVAAGAQQAIVVGVASPQKGQSQLGPALIGGQDIEGPSLGQDR